LLIVTQHSAAITLQPSKLRHLVAVLTRSGLVFGALNAIVFGASRKGIINFCTATAAMLLLRATKIIKCSRKRQTSPQVPPTGHLDRITLSVVRPVQLPGKLDETHASCLILAYSRHYIKTSNMTFQPQNRQKMIEPPPQVKYIKKIGEIWTCVFRNMRAERQTDRQTDRQTCRHAEHNTSHPYRDDVATSSKSNMLRLTVGSQGLVTV